MAKKKKSIFNIVEQQLKLTAACTGDDKRPSTDSKFSVYEDDVCIEGGFDTREEAQEAVVDSELDKCIIRIMKRAGLDRQRAVQMIQEML